MDSILQQKLEARKGLIRVASGEQESDVILQNCQLVNLFSDEIYPTDIAFFAGRIASISAQSLIAKKRIDCSGYFAIPGFIDGHVHIESTLLTPQNLAKIVLPRGTTSLLIDPMEIANVSGIKGISTFLQGTERLPLHLFIQIPSRVPTAPGLETTGGVLGVEEIKEMLLWEASVALGELDPSKVVPPLDEYILKILWTEEKNLISVGHAAGLRGLELDAYAAAGLSNDHECVTTEEAKERLRRGLAIMIREGTSERNLATLIQLTTKMGFPTDFLFFCTDDKHINDIRNEGHIDFNVRSAMSAGVSPLQAIKMASLNCARHFRLDHQIGCIAPGRFADIILTDDLRQLTAKMVFAQGQLVALNGQPLLDLPELNWPEWATKTVHIGALDPSMLAVCAQGTVAKIKVIDLIEDQIINRCQLEDIPVINGQIMPILERDLLKIVCIERHTASGNLGIGFVRGFNLKEGAIASSVSHDHHNIVVVGTNDEDIVCAAQALQELEGGFVVVRRGEIIGQLALPLFGLISLHSPQELDREMLRLNQAVASLGCPLKGPFMTLSFISLPTVPELGLTDLGLVDVASHRLTSLFA